MVDDPEEELIGVDGGFVDQGSKKYLKNERHSFKNDPSELNEIIRQFRLLKTKRSGIALREACSILVRSISKLSTMTAYTLTL